MLEPIPFAGYMEIDDMNKPVAWGMFVDGDFWDAIHPDEHNRVEGEYVIPLYTHPVKELKQIKGVNYYVDEPTVKELTDEEILNVAFCSEISTVSIENDWGGTVLEFAKAILRKAQEK